MAELDPKVAPSATLVDVGDEAGVPVIKIFGDLDLVSERQVREVVGVVLATERERVVFELGGMDFMDSSGIALLLTVAQRVREVELRNPTTAVRRLIELTGLNETVFILR